MSHTKEMVKETRSPAVWEPWREFRGLTGMSDLFEDILGGFPTMRFGAMPRGLTPKVNIKETDKEYVITAAMPGVKKDEVKINVENGVLTIYGEHKEEKEEKGKGYLRQEMSYGSFERSFVLPAGVHPEDVKASQKDGMLTVSLPKPEQAKSRGVAIKVD